MSAEEGRAAVAEAAMSDGWGTRSSQHVELAMMAPPRTPWLATVSASVDRICTCASVDRVCTWTLPSLRWRSVHIDTQYVCLRPRAIISRVGERSKYCGQLCGGSTQTCALQAAGLAGTSCGATRRVEGGVTVSDAVQSARGGRQLQCRPQKTQINGVGNHIVEWPTV
jgi:hypothetical protein